MCVSQELFDLSTSSLEPRPIMDELRYMPSSSEETFTASPVIKPRVLYETHAYLLAN